MLTGAQSGQVASSGENYAQGGSAPVAERARRTSVFERALYRKTSGFEEEALWDAGYLPRGVDNGGLGGNSSSTRDSAAPTEEIATAIQRMSRSLSSL